MNKPVKINEVEKTIRKRLKDELPNCKFAVRTRPNAFDNGIDIHLMRADFEAFVKPDDRVRLANVPFAWIKNYLTPEALDTFKRLINIIQDTNFGDNEFYLHLYVGKPDQPFELLEMEENDS